MSNQALSETFMKVVQEFGLLANDKTPCGEELSLSEAHALSLLQREQPMTQQELGQRLHLEKSTVSRLVATLEEQHWIERRTSEDDRRQKKIHLTESGTDRAKKIDRARQSRFETIIKQIPANKRNDVQESLSVFLEALHGANNSPEGNINS